MQRTAQPASHDYALQILDIIHKDAADVLSEGSEVAMLVNGLGSTPLMELYVVAHAALTHAQDKLKVGPKLCSTPAEAELKNRCPKHMLKLAVRALTMRCKPHTGARGTLTVQRLQNPAFQMIW